MCRLLTSAEIEAVQGEPVRETKPSVQPDGGMRMSQCLFRTATFAKSVTVALVAPAPGKSSALAPRKFWRAQFHAPEPKDEDERPVPGKAPGKVGPEGDEDAPKPRHLDGLGEEAYWVGNGITGALYVLQGDVFFRISVGGVHEESARIEKASHAERYAATLRQHLRANVTVEQEHGTWPGTPETWKFKTAGGKLLRD